MRVIEMERMLEGFSNIAEIKIKVAGKQKDIECIHYNIPNKTVILVAENDCEDKVDMTESNRVEDVGNSDKLNDAPFWEGM